MSTNWLVWQLVDSAFPTGGFAHSWGLETAWQLGEVTGGDALRSFLRASLLQAGHATLPFLNAAYVAPDRLETLDELNDRFLTNVVANRASRVQGRTLISTCTRIWPSSELTTLDERAGRLSGHVAPLSGAVFRLLGVPLPTAQQIVLYLTTRGVLSSAVRLGMVGNFEAQRIQYEAALDLDTVLERCHALDVDAIAQTSPVIDLCQSVHDRLYSRLFQS